MPLVLNDDDPGAAQPMSPFIQKQTELVEPVVVLEKTHQV